MGSRRPTREGAAASVLACGACCCTARCSRLQSTTVVLVGELATCRHFLRTHVTKTQVHHRRTPTFLPGRFSLAHGALSLSLVRCGNPSGMPIPLCFAFTACAESNRLPRARARLRLELPLSVKLENKPQATFPDVASASVCSGQLVSASSSTPRPSAALLSVCGCLHSSEHGALELYWC